MGDRITLDPGPRFTGHPVDSKSEIPPRFDRGPSPRDAYEPKTRPPESDFPLRRDTLPQPLSDTTGRPPVSSDLERDLASLRAHQNASGPSPAARRAERSARSRDQGPPAAAGRRHPEKNVAPPVSDLVDAPLSPSDALDPESEESLSDGLFGPKLSVRELKQHLAAEWFDVRVPHRHGAARYVADQLSRCEDDELEALRAFMPPEVRAHWEKQLSPIDQRVYEALIGRLRAPEAR
jgi:hypothetical protein